MDPAQRSDFLAASSLVMILAGFIVMASLALANAQEIAQLIVSSDLWTTTVTETTHQLASLMRD